jgi:hypothetical protein
MMINTKSTKVARAVLLEGEMLGQFQPPLPHR